MRKYRKFDEGGYTYGEDERPAPTGMSEAAELVTSGGEDVVGESGQKSKLRRNLETGELYSSDEAITRASPKAKPKAAVKPTPAVAKPTPSGRAEIPGAGRAEIPGAEPYKAPASTGEMMGETERNILNILGAVSGLRGIIPLVRTARAARAAMNPTPSTALATSETPVTFLGASGRRSMGSPDRIGATPKSLPSPKAAEETGTKAVGLSKESVNRSAAKRAMEGQSRSKEEKELLESTLRGRASRKDIQSRRPGPKKPEVSASDKADKAPRGRSSYRDDADVEFRHGGATKAYASGGSVRGWGQARGARKAKTY